MDARELINNYRQSITDNSPIEQFEGHLIGVGTPFINKDGKKITVYVHNEGYDYSINDGGNTIDDASEDEIQNLINDSELKRELHVLHINIIHADDGEPNNTLIRIKVHDKSLIPEAIQLLIQGIILINGVVPIIKSATIHEEALKNKLKNQNNLLNNKKSLSHINTNPLHYKGNTTNTNSDSSNDISSNKGLRHKATFQISKLTHHHHKHMGNLQGLRKFFSDFFD